MTAWPLSSAGGATSGGPTYGSLCFFFQAEDGIRDVAVTGVQTCALPISSCSAVGGPLAALQDGDIVSIDVKSRSLAVEGVDVAARLKGWSPPEPNYRKRSEERRVGKECRSRWSPYH